MSRPSASYLHHVKWPSSERSQACCAESRTHWLQERKLHSVAFMLSPEQPIKVVFGPEQAHLIGSIAHDCWSAPRPQTPHPLCPSNHPDSMYWTLQGPICIKVVFMGSVRFSLHLWESARTLQLFWCLMTYTARERKWLREPNKVASKVNCL